MSVDIRNSEGYLDPTPYQAFLEIEHDEHRALRAFRPIVYICSPYAGDVERNVAAARKYSRFAMERGYIPIAPHLLFPQFMDDSKPTERELGLFFGNAVMRGLGVRQDRFTRHGRRDQARTLEELPAALLHRGIGGDQECAN